MGGRERGRLQRRVNDGKTAGQIVFHGHTHLIPRRKGDAEDPTGGVRNVIPGKGAYRRPGGFR